MLHASTGNSNTFRDRRALIQHLEGIISVLLYSFTVLPQKQVIATQLPAKMEARAQKRTLDLNASVHHSGIV